MKGERIPVDAPERVADEVAHEAGCIPFYVHQIVGAMRERGQITSGDARRLVSESLRVPHDPWEMRHYRTRLNKDYEPADQACALAVLDAIAASREPLTFAELANRAKARPGVTDDEQVRVVCKNLEQDHYITKAPDTSRYGFRTELIGEWWRLERDL